MQDKPRARPRRKIAFFLHEKKLGFVACNAFKNKEKTKFFKKINPPLFMPLQ